MKQKPKRQRYYTFMIVPHDPEGKSFCLRVPLLAVRLTMLLVLFSLLFVGSTFVYSSILSRRLIHYHKAIAANRQQMKVIDDFSQETARVHQAISELVQEDNELRKLLGLKSWRSKIRLSEGSEEKSSKVSHDLAAAGQKIEEKKESLAELKDWVSQVRLRYANTPSRWPLYGRIVSRFGYRVYPWRGFHTGLDISGLYGAPIRVTGNGYVSFAGWRRGYGRTVIVTHGFGKSTLYAHCSRFAVQQGQQVAKGQVVAYVGNTGYTTGPHLHYEVRDNNKPVNPVAYLDLNILTASKIWRR